MGSTTPLPQSLEGKQDANSEVHGSWTPGQEREVATPPQGGAAPRDREGPVPARGSGKELRPVF